MVNAPYHHGRQSDVHTLRLFLMAVVLMGVLLPLLPGSQLITKPASLASASILPLAFEANDGFIDSPMQYVVHGVGSTLFFGASEVALALDGKPEQGRSASNLLRLRFVNSNEEANIEAGAELPGKVNYLHGSDPSKWRTNLPTYASIVYRGLYPGIDLGYSGTNSQLKGTYTLAPHADPALIRWRYDGSSSVAVDNEGNLRVCIDNCNDSMILTEHAPIAWQERDGRRKDVVVRYQIAGDGTISFSLGAYERAYPLIIDPVISYSTYLGGTSQGYQSEGVIIAAVADQGTGIAVDSAGNAYITGWTLSRDFPTANAAQPNHRGNINSSGFPERTDAFVTKLNAEGSAIEYSTFLGGTSSDSGVDIAVDAAGNAYVVGRTESGNFPLVTPFQLLNGGGGDLFLTKLSPTGSLVYSTYLGGSGSDTPSGIAVDASGNAYLTGSTMSVNFRTRNPLQATNRGNGDAFLTKVSASGTDILYSTYLGGTAIDSGADVAVDPQNNAYVAGSTNSTDFMVVPQASAFQRINRGAGDAFVTKINSAGSAILYSTYLGGSGSDSGQGIAVDAGGNAYVTGATASNNFPLMIPRQTALLGAQDAFVSKVNSAGTGLFYSTYLGGGAKDSGIDIALDSARAPYIAGVTESNDFPTANPPQASRHGGSDAFAVKLSVAGPSLSYSTYLGGSQDETSVGIAVDTVGSAYILGNTYSNNFPLVSAYQPTYKGYVDAFITKILEPQAPPPPTPATLPTPGGSGGTPMPPPVALPGSGSRLFPETGKTVLGLFLQYWLTHGALPQQGYPISDVIGEISDLNGQLYTVQYFERAVFEYHPENPAPFNVLLSQLGTFRYREKYPNGAPNQQENRATARFFPETGHWVGGRFWQYWQQNGGLAQQGFPLSDEFTEVSDLNGQSYTVQYFERAVFEYHPENQPPFDVLLSQLGTFRYAQKYGGR